MFWNNKYPYTDYSQINLDALARNVAQSEKAVKDFSVKLTEFSDHLTTVDESIVNINESIENIETEIDELKRYVTPFMFGAAGDGVTIDNDSLNDCFEYCVTNNIPCDGLNRTYLIDNSTPSLANHYGLIVNGGIKMKNFHFVLADDCPDMTTILACKYSDIPYIIENCTFEGKLRTIIAGTEDGGNHGIIFCNGTTMFPLDWQDYAEVKITNCKFINIQSYGIFPSPLNNKLIIKNCDFSCHGPGMLAYAVNSEIINCNYTYLSGSNTTVHSLLIDEIENFSSPAAYKKNVFISGCRSDHRLYTINHGTQTGLIYGKICIDNCESDEELITSLHSGFDITGDVVIIKNSTAKGIAGDYGFSVSYFTADVFIDSVKFSKKSRVIITGNCSIRNTEIQYQINISNSVMTKFLVEDCTFAGTHTDGIITSVGSATYAAVTYFNMINCLILTASQVLRNLNAAVINIDGLIAIDKQIRILFNPTATDTNVYASNVIAPIANTTYAYFVEGITGKVVVRGIGGPMRFFTVGGSASDMLAIP